MPTITTRAPIALDGTTIIAITVGAPVAQFGDEVTLVSTFDGQTYEGRYVAGVDTAPLRDIAPEVTALFGIEKHQFLSRMERFYQTGLAFGQAITIYTLYDRPVEHTGEAA